MPRLKKIEPKVKLSSVKEAHTGSDENFEVIEKLKNEINRLSKENNELKSNVVKIAVVEPFTRFVRKNDIIKLLKTFSFNEPDLSDFEIAITNSAITLKATTKSNITVSLPLAEAQKYQL